MAPAEEGGWSRPLEWRRVLARLKHGERWSDIRWVTPTESEEWLQRNHRNRTQRRKRVEFLAGEITDGRWELTNDAICFDRNGNLINGQHRLEACILAGLPILVLVMFGVDKKAQATMDIQSRRTLADQLPPEVRQRNLVASCCNLGFRWETGDPLRNRLNPSYSKALEWFEKNPSLSENIKEVTHAVRVLKIPPTPMVVTWHQLVQIDPVESLEFLKQMASGEELVAGDPVLALRNWMMNQWNRRSPEQDEYHARLIKAWNAWALGKEVLQSSWRRRGAGREEFPELLDLDGGLWKIRSEL